MIASRPSPPGPLALAACFGLAACASAPHVTAYQEARFEPAPRTVALATEQDPPLPLGIAREDVARALARAGFAMTADRPRYRLTLTAAVGSAAAGSFVPGDDARTRPSWIGRADHDWRTRVGGGAVTRVTAVLVESATNREMWRGTGTARGRDAVADAHLLVGEVLAALPRN